MTASPITAATIATAAVARATRLRCCMKTCFGKPCPRKVVWRVDGVGVMCNWCWTMYFDEHYMEIELEAIHRLSEEEDDFYGTTPSGRNCWKHTKNGKKHK